MTTHFYTNTLPAPTGAVVSQEVVSIHRCDVSFATATS
jgi:hypothetical protein